MAGWALGLDWLRGFGIANYPDWPLTALSNLLIALSYMLMFAGHRDAARGTLLAPAVVAVATVAEYLGRINLGFDTLFFPAAVRTIAIANPGRPGLVPAVSILLLSVAGWLASSRGRRSDAVILVCCSMAVGLASMSIALLLFKADLHGEPFRLASSLPAAFSPIGLALGLIAWRAGRSGDRRGGPFEWRLALLSLPAIIILPAVLFPIEVRLAQAGVLAPIGLEVIASALNLLVVIALLVWSMTALWRERHALHASEQRLALATEAHGVGIFEWEMASNRLVWSEGSERQLGMPAGTIMDFESWSAHVSPADVATIVAEVDRAAAARAERYTFRYGFRRPDGEIRQIEGSARCIYDHDGKLVSSIGVNIDVTVRERQEAQLRSIVETVPSALVIIDTEGRILRFSPAAERMFGWTAADVAGANVSMLMPDDQARHHDHFLARYMAGGERHVIGQTRQLTALRKDGTTFPIELNVGESWAAGERLFTGFIRDISERVAATARLEQLQVEFGHSARLAAMGEIAAGLAHEINQPLAASANFLSAAELTMGDDPAPRDAVRRAQEQILRAGAIIRRLRDFLAKGEADSEPHSVHAVIKDAVALTLVGRDRSCIDVELVLDPAASTMMADRVQIQQVLVNLLRNAAEALDGRAGGTITITTRAIAGHRMVVEVRDNGPGLSPEMLERLYTPFVSTKRQGGMGVGLSICRRIIEAHGGSIHAENLPGGGASFSFIIPQAITGELAA